MRITILSCLAGALLGIVAMPALGQTGPAPLAAATSLAPAAAQTQSQVQAATEQRIASLQSQLAITVDQAPLWNSFVQVMRENAQNTDAQFRQRAAGAQAMNAAANMRSYADVSRAYADGNDKLATAFQTLYDTFSDKQKQTADTLFRQQAAQQPAARRK